MHIASDLHCLVTCLHLQGTTHLSCPVGLHILMVSSLAPEEALGREESRCDTHTRSRQCDAKWPLTTLINRDLGEVSTTLLHQQEYTVKEPSIHSLSTHSLTAFYIQASLRCWDSKAKLRKDKAPGL